MVCYGCFAFFLLLGGLLVTLVGYYPLDMDHSLQGTGLRRVKVYINRKTRYTDHKVYGLRRCFLIPVVS